MVVVYVHNGYAEDALKLYREMKAEAVWPNSKSFAIVLSVCAHLEAMEEGKQVYAHIIKTGFVFNVSVSNGLVSLYAKCANIDYAAQVLNRMNRRNIVS